MIGFIVPFKPKSQSNNWVSDNHLLGQTLSGILRQTQKDFLIYVVYTDMPTHILQDDQIKYIRYPKPFEHYVEIQDAEKYFHLFKRKLFMARFYDKGKKVTWGCAAAKNDGCQYIMCVDADDLISNRIVEFVNDHSNNGEVDGWYISKGFVWKKGSSYVLKQNQMQNFNGSTHILRADYINIPDFSSTDWSDYSLFAAHGWVVSRVKEHFGKILQPIPFRAVIYVVHESNDSKISESLKKFNFKSMAKKFLRGQLLTQKIKLEFGIQ